MNEQEHPGVDTVCPMGPPRADGTLRVLHHTRNGTYSMAELRPLQDGKPLMGQLVKIEGSGVWRQMKPIITGAPKSGPAIANSREYCDGWTTIFGHQTYGQA